MTVINAVGNALTGSTGSGSFVGATSPTLVTPTIGAATSTSITFSPSTGGIVGTPTNDNVTAGDVGEYVESVVLASSPVSFTTGVQKDLTTISLTAGDWDVYANLGFTGTTITLNKGWISTTSASEPDSAYESFCFPQSTQIRCNLTIPPRRLSLSGTTTVYVSGQANGTGTITGYGFISARRRR